MVARGSKAASGSWNTICIWRRRARNRLSGMPSISSPSRCTFPSVASVNLRSTRPTVDLPDPDSPTMAKVSPGCTAKLIPSTARATRCRSLASRVT